ncbi:MAG: hypothetical protein J6A50_02310 [Clostridia bacterium]|nr:hypothetical protein [Clostridia bacterium]
MIIFDGYITGNSEKRFRQKSITLGQNIMLLSLTLFFPAVLHLSLKLKSWIIILLYGLMFIIIPLGARIPNSAKEKKAITPKKIIIKDGYITCLADKYEEIRNISDIKTVWDWGEFYEINFPFGKISEKFICQKDLLTIGSIEEFEDLFADKIVRK